MISPASAARLASTLDPNRLRASVSLALLDGRILQPDSRGDAQPEDLAVAIISGPPGTARDAVLAGCRDVCAELLLALAKSEPTPDAPIPGHELALRDALAHFGALVNRSAPQELAQHAKSLLQLVLQSEVDRTLRGPIVRAALAYAHSESEAPFWEPLVAGDLIPVWAFKALMQINPRHSRVVRALGSLWIRSLRGDLKLNLPLVARDVARQQSDPAKFLTQLLRFVERTIGPSQHRAARQAKWNKLADLAAPLLCEPSVAAVYDEMRKALEEAAAKKIPDYKKLSQGTFAAARGDLHQRASETSLMLAAPSMRYALTHFLDSNARAILEATKLACTPKASIRALVDRLEQKVIPSPYESLAEGLTQEVLENASGGWNLDLPRRTELLQGIRRASAVSIQRLEPMRISPASIKSDFGHRARRSIFPKRAKGRQLFFNA